MSLVLACAAYCPLADIQKTLLLVISTRSSRPIFGLIFLFKWRKETDLRPIADDTVGDVFFAHQVKREWRYSGKEIHMMNKRERNIGASISSLISQMFVGRERYSANMQAMQTLYRH